MIQTFILSNTPSVISLLKDAIDRGHDDYRFLPATEKRALAAECMKVLGHESGEALVSGNEDVIAHHLVRYLSTSNREHALDISETMAKCAEKHFEDSLFEVFEKCKEESETETYRSHGLTPHNDRINGEIIWR